MACRTKAHSWEAISYHVVPSDTVAPFPPSYHLQRLHSVGLLHYVLTMPINTHKSLYSLQLSYILIGWLQRGHPFHMYRRSRVVVLLKHVKKGSNKSNAAQTLLLHSIQINRNFRLRVKLAESVLLLIGISHVNRRFRRIAQQWNGSDFVPPIGIVDGCLCLVITPIHYMWIKRNKNWLWIQHEFEWIRDKSVIYQWFIESIYGTQSIGRMVCADLNWNR